MTDIKGRTAFITGGANGIGLGIARVFAREGAKLALTARNAEGLAKAKEELKGITQVETFAFDVRDREAFAAAAEAAERALGPVTLLFNNAGVALGDPVNRMSYEMWDYFIGINVYGVTNGLVAFLPKMIERGLGGHIVNVSSGLGLFAGPNPYYTASKFAVVGMSEALRINKDVLAANIGVSVLCPAMVATNIVKASLDRAPTVGVQLTPDQEKELEMTNKNAGEALLTQGISIDVVGEMVLKGVRENALYIITDHAMEPVLKARSKALLEALPNQA